MLLDMCADCPKANGWIATGWRCTVYAKPHKLLWARHNKKCPFNGGMDTSKKKKKKVVNFLKQSKRSVRGG